MEYIQMLTFLLKIYIISRKSKEDDILGYVVINNNNKKMQP